MPLGSSRRVAILGLLLECNRFAPVTTRDDFLSRLYVAGDEILDALNSAGSRLPQEVLGFRSTMDAACEWQPAPILIGQCESGGPLEHGFYRETLEDMRARLRAALPLDAVYIANHGALITTECRDPDGEIFSMVRAVVGPDVPIVATLDLHANVSEQMVQQVDLVIGYQTNPHVDMAARGADAARAILDLWDGMRTHAALVRLPIIPPTVSLRTDRGPYAELWQQALSRQDRDAVNVSVFGGFAYADTEKNGLAIVVTSRSSRGRAQSLADELAALAWAQHRRYVASLTDLPAAVDRTLEACRSPSHAPVILADVADNPGGGGNGNTTAILEALLTAGAEGVLMGLVHDPALAAQAHALGEGARFEAVFNRDGGDAYARRLQLPATVAKLRDGDCVGRRGLYAGRRMNLGPSTLLDLGGIRVAVVSIRTQCADPAFLEMFSQDIGKARAVVVKSRGHFRAGFDEYFGDAQVIEVDAPGLTSPVLSRFEFRHLPRPAFPLDPMTGDWPSEHAPG